MKRKKLTRYAVHQKRLAIERAVGRRERYKLTRAKPKGYVRAGRRDVYQMEIPKKRFFARKPKK